MGGQSFKCPQCEKWFTEKGPLHDHLVNKHNEPKGFMLIGTASSTSIHRSVVSSERNKDAST